MSSSPKVKKSIFIVGLEKISMIFIQLLTSFILARLLTPSDYGTIAMIAIFISLSSALAEAGLGGSLIFYNDVDERDYSTVFWLNTITSIVLYVIIWIIASPIATFYSNEDIALILKVSGISIIFSAFGTIQLSLMYKNLQFKKIAIVSIISYVVSAVVAILLAYYGWGVWALVAQQVLVSMTRAVLLSIINRFIPSLILSKQLVLKHWNFGKGLLFSTLLKTVYDNMYLQLIGKYCNVVNAGYYNQSKKIKDIPSNLFCNVFETSLFPIFSKYTDEQLFVVKARKIIRFFALFVSAIFFLTMLCSHEIILLLLGGKWEECSWMLSVLSLGAIFFVFETVNRSMMKARGLSNVIFKVDLVKRTISLLVMFLSILLFDIKGIVIAFVFNSMFGWLANVYVLSKKVKYNIKMQFNDLFFYVFLSAVAAIVLYSLELCYLPCNVYLKVIFFVVSFILLYFGLLVFLKDQSLRLALGFIKKKLHK